MTPLPEPKPVETTTLNASPKALQLASDLGAEVGREQGDALLKQARAALMANSSRPGSSTSEYKLAMIGILAGLGMVALGVWKDQPDLRTTGADLVTYCAAGYAASRGLAKLGAGIGPKADPKA